MKIIFMGTPDFAVPALKKLIASRHDVVAVYTQKPKAAGRGLKIIKSYVHEVADMFHLDVYTPDSLKNDDEIDKFHALKADVAVVAAYGMLLPEEILESPKHGCINIHPSLLPRWRGAAPLQRAIMSGDKNSGVCIMKMDKGLDTGDVILAEEFEIPATEDCGWLHDKCAEIGAELILKAIEQIETGKAKYKKQGEIGVTYAKKITKDDEKIDFSRAGHEIVNKIRALSPYPGANFVLDNVKYKIFAAEFIAVEEISAGKILNDKFHIGCSDGFIIPKVIQREGKQRMNIDDFLKGNKVDTRKIIQ